MKAIRVHEFGGPEVLKLEDLPTPKPSSGEVLVRIHAAGVNPYDTYMRAGTYAVKPSLPYTPGSDGAGVPSAPLRGSRTYPKCRPPRGSCRSWKASSVSRGPPLPAACRN
jgi:hypothetical protein